MVSVDSFAYTSYVYTIFCVEYHQTVPGLGERGEGVVGDMGMGGSEPGTLGQMDNEQQSYSGYSGSFEDEPPLLQELGIDFELIKQKVILLMNMWLGIYLYKIL